MVSRVTHCSLLSNLKGYQMVRFPQWCIFFTRAIYLAKVNILRAE